MKQNLVDQAQFEVKAGNGGNGCVSFLRNKQTRKGGPDGGDGGKGGSIWFEANGNMTTLRFFAGRDRFRADNGGRGEQRNRHGLNAKDMTIQVPVGTLAKLTFKNIENQTVTEEVDFNTAGQRVLMARGGNGGRGNKAFASSINTTPKEAEMGGKGEKKKIELELKILADVGLIGLPNVGKSTLLSVLTKATPEIADYPFTTLVPNLGVMEIGTTPPRQIVIADIPGLIEEAHKGKGLGDEFLKHIERCQVLVHILAVDLDWQMKTERSVAETLYANYLAVRRELGEYNKLLLDKPEVVVVNKAELLTDKTEEILKYFEEHKVKPLMISAATHVGLEELRLSIQRILIEREQVTGQVG